MHVNCRHGAEDADGKDRGRRVLAVRRARHRAPGARHRLQLLAHLHAEPAVRQAASPARTLLSLSLLML